MAEPEKAIFHVLQQEDARLTGIVTEDRGGRTRFGIAERFHPELGATGFYECDHNAALKIAMLIYKHEYWNVIRGEQIRSQRIANALLSFAVVEGVHEAVVLLQRALGCMADGELGPQTITYLNAIADGSKEEDFIQRWEDLECRYFEQVVAAHPDQAKFLHGWKARAAQA